MGTAIIFENSAGWWIADITGARQQITFPEAPAEERLIDWEAGPDAIVWLFQGVDCGSAAAGIVFRKPVRQECSRSTTR